MVRSRRTKKASPIGRIGALPIVGRGQAGRGHEVTVPVHSSPGERTRTNFELRSVMKQGPPDTSGWVIIVGRSEGDYVPGLPADLWSHEWRETQESIRLTDPVYGSSLQLAVVETGDQGETFRLSD